MGVDFIKIQRTDLEDISNVDGVDFHMEDGLQALADDISLDLNNFIDGCEYDEERQEYYPDDSEKSWGCMLFGKMTALEKLDPNLNWDDPESRFGQMDMSLFN